ncbi:MAG: hypothetical protein MPK06_04040 [Alphaproteobacteria bacterium]|nr:hypothetical protein [Alphaproteobacteria bacterium]MDA8013424.1 hypothetical protein [Alphaproteobacteria bacterium]
MRFHSAAHGCCPVLASLLSLVRVVADGDGDGAGDDSVALLTAPSLLSLLSLSLLSLSSVRVVADGDSDGAGDDSVALLTAPSLSSLLSLETAAVSLLLLLETAAVLLLAAETATVSVWRFCAFTALKIKPLFSRN